MTNGSANRTPWVKALLVRASAVLAVSLAWDAACTVQQEVSAEAEAVGAAMAKEQLDELPLSQLSQAMRAGAVSFLRALPGTRRRQARRGFEDGERKDWDFWPSQYPGARMDRIAPEPRALADQLLRLGLSAAGYEKLKLVQALEPYNPWSSPYYSLMVFGEPENNQPWGWRFQGHHLSLNVTLAGDEMIANTPLFLGTQPLSRSDVAQGKAPLGDEEALARKLYMSLNPNQKQRADIERPPYTYLPERTPAAKRQQPLGIPARELSAAQRDNLEALIKTYIHNIAPAVAAERWREIEQAGLDAIGFAWAGSGCPGRDHYYRIQGPAFIIEYDSRDGGSHIHSVWRSFEGDFGEDLLRKHYAIADLGHGHSEPWAP